MFSLAKFLDTWLRTMSISAPNRVSYAFILWYFSLIDYFLAGLVGGHICYSASEAEKHFYCAHFWEILCLGIKLYVRVIFF